MGEARYYAILRFPSDEAANAALPKVEKFLKRIHECYEEWQANRSNLNIKGFSKKYSDVFHHLGLSVPPEGHPMLSHANFLSGELDSPYGADDYEIYTCWDQIRFAGTVWHLCSWNRLIQAMKVFGAIEGGWESDEYVNVYDATGLHPIE